ncbi:MAG: ABC transporter ATPase [Flavobacteriaceae bacterium]|nr:ABC transporter ATPase [Flavobacteriaceae bacterium]|tara:strand:- start:448 stop:930 length:483 start_codon:yes stop_codon:yes gene_type:complete
MLVPFEALSDEARVWIYPASRPFTSEEFEEITATLHAFLTEWTAHGASLKAGVSIPYNRFIVIAIDESQQETTGCSIDASVKIIKEIEATYGVTLLDKMNVSFKQGEYITYKPLMDFKKMVKNKAVTKNTIIFNNLVVNKEEFLTQWEVPAHQSWHARYF